jgi:hypothetical protein
MRARSAFASAAILVMVASVVWTAVPASAGARSCRTRVNDTPRKLMECVTLAGVREHQAAFQAIADANGGNRFSGLPGYDASVDYVVERLEAAGYDPVVQSFDYLAFAPLGPSVLQQTARRTTRATTRRATPTPTTAARCCT